MGEPARHREPAKPHGAAQALVAYFSPLAEFLKREGALVVLLFVLIHKIGDTLANLTLRLLFQDLGFTNDEVALLRRRRRLRRAAGRHLRRRHALRAARHEALGADQPGADGDLEFELRRAGGGRPFDADAGVAIGFENFASGIGGVTVVAYLSALCNLRFTATQYALLSAPAASPAAS